MWHHVLYPVNKNITYNHMSTGKTVFISMAVGEEVTAGGIEMTLPAVCFWEIYSHFNLRNQGKYSKGFLVVLRHEGHILSCSFSKLFVVLMNSPPAFDYPLDGAVVPSTMVSNFVSFSCIFLEISTYF